MFKAVTVHIIRLIRGLVVLRFRKTRGEVKLPDISFPIDYVLK